jgi:hypothetical protein
VHFIDLCKPRRGPATTLSPANRETFQREDCLRQLLMFPMQFRQYLTDIHHCDRSAIFATFITIDNLDRFVIGKLH